MSDEKELTMARLLHDVRGPLVNISGFHSELVSSLKKLESLLPVDDGSANGECCSDINSLMENDVQPCLKYIQISIDQLAERIDRFEKQLRDTV